MNIYICSNYCSRSYRSSHGWRCGVVQSHCAWYMYTCIHTYTDHCCHSLTNILVLLFLHHFILLCITSTTIIGSVTMLEGASEDIWRPIFLSAAENPLWTEVAGLYLRSSATKSTLASISWRRKMSPPPTAQPQQSSPPQEFWFVLSFDSSSLN